MRRTFCAILLLGALASGRGDGAEPAGRDLLAGAPGPLAEALTAFAQERDRWAYTERFVTTNRKGAVKETRVIRFDPSRAPEDRWTLLEEDGRPADERARRKFDREMTKAGDKRIKLSEYLQLDRAVLVRQSPAEAVYEVPLRKENNDRLPPDKFQVLVTLTRAPWRLAAIDVGLREPMRVALIAKVRKGGAAIRFARVGEEQGPVVQAVSGQGEATVLLVRVGGGFSAERSDFKRVTPFEERFQVKMGNLDYLDF